MARRRIGTAGARALATAGSLADAVDILARSPYGLRVRAGASLADAQRGVAETLLWHLRVLAGWLPPAGAEILRIFAGGFEIANVDEHVRVLAGEPADPPFRLGSLATSWPALSAAASRAELRVALARSPWGDPGGESPQELQLGPRLSWAERLASRVEPAAGWVFGATALLVAREIAAGRPLPAGVRPVAMRLIGPAATAASHADLVEQLRPSAAWALANVRDAGDLWQAEAGWWKRLRQDGMRSLTASGFGPGRVIGAVAVLGADAAILRGALEIAARNGAPLEVLDAMA